MIQKLRRKFIVVIMSAVTVLIAAAFLAVLLSTTGNMRRDSVSALRMAVSQMTAPAKPGMAIQAARVPMLTAVADSSGAIDVINNDIHGIGDEDVFIISSSAIQSGYDTGVISEYNLRYMVQPAAYGAKVVAFTDTSFEKEILNNLIIDFTLIGMTTLFVFFVISVFLSKWVVRPVEEAWNRQRQFVADASHELKTPLTVVLSNAGMLIEDKSAADEKNMTRLENIAVEARRMKHLVDDMLSLARSDGAAVKPAPDRLDLSYLVNCSVLMMEPGLFEAGKRIECSIDDGISVMGDESRLRQLTEILLDNACKYGSNDGLISVRLHADRGDAVLEIANEGETIPQEELAKIFERFYRADKARSSGGYGLGLAIAKTIVSEHGGRITVKSEDGLTTFCVQLRLA